MGHPEARRPDHVGRRPRELPAPRTARADDVATAAAVSLTPGELALIKSALVHADTADGHVVHMLIGHHEAEILRRVLAVYDDLAAGLGTAG